MRTSHKFVGSSRLAYIFICNFAAIARLLVSLTRKGVPFEWGDAQCNAMMDEIIKSPALCHLDYMSGREVVLAVDTSVIAVSFILSQEGEDGKHYPNRFGSISLTSIESQYSQAKLELYGLFWALCTVRVFIFGAANLVVEMDAKYVKGMINNPDLQLSMTINWWIAGILLFHFELHHISADKHTSPNKLSYQPPSAADPAEEDNIKDWLDNSYSFCITLLNDWTFPFAMTPVFFHTCHSSSCHRPSLSPAMDCSVLAPSNAPVPSLTYTSVFSSSVKWDTLLLDSPTIPRSVKATAKEARIHLICEFFET